MRNFIFPKSGGGLFNTGGGGRGLGHFQTGLIRESREITLRNARRKIEALAQQLSLRRDRIDMAFHFFKLALNKHLTRGRKSTHVIAACVYITCRTESTPHMLIDFSDILQIDVYELGRTYLRLSQALCINIPGKNSVKLKHFHLIQRNYFILFYIFQFFFKLWILVYMS